YKKATSQSLKARISTIKGCNKNPTPTLGVVNLNVIVHGCSCPHQFVCLQDEHMNETMILGIPCMRTYKSVPDLDTNQQKLSPKGG
ncbi:hypothetical protein, partial [Enterobacter cloacae complex sp. 4DZ3-17B2]|uniref:hypothetical protein n=1 Tax=Enterobacter cloacae complex sp. 4DZ3-17B2 TaxID=2511990 RepID=UPI001CA5CCF3